MSFEHILTQMIVLCIPIVIGFVAAKLGFLDDQMDSSLTRLIINVTLPCLILASASSSDGLPDVSVVLQLLGFSALGYVIALAVAAVLPPLMRAPAQEGNVYRFATVFGNVGFIGYPVLSAIYGPTAVLYAAIASIPNSLVLYSVGEAMLQSAAAPGSEGAADEALPLRRRLARMARSTMSPTFLASLALLALVLLQVDDLGVLGDGLGVVGDFTTPAALLVTGAALASYNPLDMFTNWRAYVTAVARLLLVPLAMLALMGGLVPDELVRGVIVVGAAMPVASVGVLFCLLYGVDVKPMMQATFLSILGSVASIPLLALLI